MKTIGELLGRNLDRKIEEIIKVDQTDEQSVYFDDGVVRLVKWHPSRHGSKPCFNELVASRLAQLLGAPLLRGAVVYVPDDVIPPDYRAIGASPGFHFAVPRMEGENFIPAAHYSQIENDSELPAPRCS